MSFNQTVWLDEQFIENNARLKMTDDLMEQHLSIGLSKEKTRLLLGFPDAKETDMVLRNEIESDYDNVSEILSDNSSLTKEQKVEILKNWFDQSTLIQDQFSYLLSWTNGAEPYPVYLNIVFLNNKLVSSEILIKQ
jgi:hypothetical protein